MRVRTALLAAAVPTAALGAVLLAGGPAAPAVRDVADARGDVWSWASSGDGEGSFHRSAAVTNVDVARFAVRHSDRDVVVRFRYADLRKQGPSYGVAVDVRTDEGVRRHASFVANAGNGWLGRTRLLDRHRRDVGCARAHAHVSYRRDTVRLTFPRRCLSNPGWVQVEAMTYVKSARGLLVDDPGSDGPLARRWSPRAAHGRDS